MDGSIDVSMDGWKTDEEILHLTVNLVDLNRNPCGFCCIKEHAPKNARSWQLYQQDKTVNDQGSIYCLNYV